MNMITKNERHAAGDKAGEYFINGFHCAEAVAAAVLESIGEDSEEASAHATAFGGGCGRTFNELCGALSGGLIAIGHLCGRRTPGGNWDLPARLSAKIRQLFLEDFETTHCASLRNRFGDGQQADECQKIVSRVTIALLELLAQHQPDVHNDLN